MLHRVVEWCSTPVTIGPVYQPPWVRGKLFRHRQPPGTGWPERHVQAPVSSRGGTGSVATVHPIERLRYVARGGWGDPAMLAAEAAWALADLLEHEPPAAVPACRRLLERHPASGPMWWVSARVLSARDPVAEAERCAEELAEDTTEDVLDASLPEDARVVRHGGVGEVAAADLVVVDVEALGPGGMVVDGDDVGLLDAARALEVPVWAVAGVGRVLPPRLWAALVRRVDGSRPPLSRPAAVVDLGGVERVVGPDGARPTAAALEAVDCPEPPELLGDS